MPQTSKTLLKSRSLKLSALALTLTTLMAGTAMAQENFTVSSKTELDNLITTHGKTFEELTGKDFGALQVTGDLTTDSTVYDGLIFTGNQTPEKSGSTAYNGGAIQLGENAKLSLTQAYFADNTASQHGGAVYLTGTSALTVKGATFTGNRATGDGGAVEVWAKPAASDKDSQLTVSDAVFSNNQAANGGAVGLYRAAATFTDTAFTNNTATGWGGALRVNASQVTFAVSSGQTIRSTGNHSTTDGNVATWYDGHTGGFMYLQGGQATFDIGAQGHYIIGQNATDPNTDSITGYGTNTLTKTGAGTLTIESSTEGYTGTIDVKAGTLQLATGFGSYDVIAQGKVNAGVTVTSDMLTASELKVGTGAEVLMGDATVDHQFYTTNGSTKHEAGVTYTVSASGVLAGSDLTLQRRVYKDIDGTDSSKSFDTQGGYLTINNSGDTSFKQVTLKDKSLLEVAGSGLTTFDSLDLQGGELKVSGVLAVTGAIQVANSGVTTTLTSTGTLETGWKNLFSQSGSSYELTDFGKTLASGSGHVIELDYTGTYTLDDLSKAKTKLQLDNGASFSFGNGILVTKDASGNATNVGFDSIKDSGGNFGHSTIDVTSNSISTEKDISVGALHLSGSNTSFNITSSNGGSVTLTGNTQTGQVFSGVSQLDSVTTSGAFVLGTQVSQAIIVNAAKLSSNDLSVNGTVDAQAVEVSGSSASGTVAGNLAVTSLTVGDGATFNVSSTGSLHLKGGQSADGAVTDLTGNVTIHGVLSTQTSRDTARALASYVSATTTGAAYVDRALNLGSGRLTIGQNSEFNNFSVTPRTATSTVTIASGAVAVIDASAFIYTPASTQPATAATTHPSVFGAESAVNNQGTLVFTHVSKTGQIDVGGEGSTLAANEFRDSTGTLTTDNQFLKAQVGSTAGTVLITYQSVFSTDGKSSLDEALQARYAQGLSAKELSIMQVLGTDATYFDPSTGQMTAAGTRAFEQATGGNATSGVYNTAYDTNAQVVDALTRHQLDPSTLHQGVWADIFYAQNQADTLYGNTGYKSTIYGGVIGFDNTFVCGANAGLALSIGTADTKSVGGAFETQLDTDFWGLSAYAAKGIDQLHFKVDVGYLALSNDLSGLGDAADASTMTVGLRADYGAYDTGLLQMTPHFGLRYTHIRADDVAFNDGQSLNVVEMPIGVNFATRLESPQWVIRPNFDFTIVPQLGDKNVQTFANSDVTVLSSGLYNATLGVAAEWGATTLGLQATYGFGAADRANTQVNLRAAYRF